MSLQGQEGLGVNLDRNGGQGSCIGFASWTSGLSTWGPGAVAASLSELAYISLYSSPALL